MAYTPNQLINHARQRYNATGDKFFSDDELLSLVWAAQTELAVTALCVKQVFTTTSVAGQQQYISPSNFLGIFRATYDGDVLKVDTLDNALRQTEGLSASSGFSDVIAHWDNVLYLSPIPSATGKTIKVWAYVEPQEVEATSSLEVPSRHQFKIVNYLLAEMAFKDNNERLGDRYARKWEADVEKATREERKLEKTGGFAVVRNEDWLNGVE